MHFLGSDIQSALPEMRAMAESLMVDSCRIYRFTGDRGPLGPDGKYGPRPTVDVYEGKCKIQIDNGASAPATTEGAGRDVSSQEPGIHLPVAGSESVAVNDMCEILSSVNDAALVGRVFTVRSRHAKSFATARRLRVIEVVA